MSIADSAPSGRWSPQSIATDRAAKLERVQAILDAHAAPAIALTTAETLAWLFDGARVTVPFGGAPVFSSTVRRDGSIVVVAPANELPRLRDEELGDEVELTTVAWHEPLPEPGPGVLREVDVASELRAARASLLPVERGRYSELGRDVTRVMTSVIRGARRVDTERALAAELARAIVAEGAEPVVLLVAGEGRLAHQHPLPTIAPLGGRAMVVVGARRHGLIVSVSRWVGLGSPGEPAAEAALREVEADAFAATRPGRELREVLADIAHSYERHGFGAEAWLRHHQGGPAGYLGRDPKVTPDSRERVATDQAFAWNPWVPGAKLEDTIIVGAGGIEVLTVDPDWPTVSVRGIPRPVPLELG